MSYINEWFVEVARSTVNGWSPLHLFGNNADIDTGTEDLWSNGGTFVAPTTARVHAIVSGSVADDGDPVGTGARTVKVYGLDASYVEASETVTLNGTTPVNTTGSYTMIYLMEVLTAGSGGVNAGAITATAATDSTVTCAIPIGANRSSQAIFMVPVGETLLLTKWAVVSNAAATALLTATLQVKEFGGAWQIRDTFQTSNLIQSNLSRDFNPPLAIPAKALVRITVTSAADNQPVSGSLQGVYGGNSQPVAF